MEVRLCWERVIGDACADFLLRNNIMKYVNDVRARRCYRCGGFSDLGTYFGMTARQSSCRECSAADVTVVWSSTREDRALRLEAPCPVHTVRGRRGLHTQRYRRTLAPALARPVERPRAWGCGLRACARPLCGKSENKSATQARHVKRSRHPLLALPQHPKSSEAACGEESLMAMERKTAAASTWRVTRACAANK